MIIPGFSQYDISEAGVVTHLPTGRVLKHHKVHISDYYEYLTVTVFDDNGRRHMCNIVRLLAMTYLDKPNVPCMARTKDGNNTNIALSNIEWVPYVEATKRAWERGKMANRSPRKSSVTEGSIALMYDTMCLYDEPVTMTELSNILELPYSVVRYSVKALIIRGKVIKHAKGFEAIR